MRFFAAPFAATKVAMSLALVKTALLVAVSCGCVALLTFLSSRPAPRGIQVYPPSEFPLLHDRYPQLRQIDRDLASGRLSLADAVDIVMPLVQENYRLAKGTEFRGKGLRPGVAMMLCDWVETMAEDDPGLVSSGVLDRLHEDCKRIRAER